VRFQLEVLKWNLDWKFWNGEKIQFGQNQHQCKLYRRFVFDDEWNIVCDSMDHVFNQKMQNCDWIHILKNEHEIDRTTLIELKQKIPFNFEKHLQKINIQNHSNIEDQVKTGNHELKESDYLIAQTIEFVYCNQVINDTTMFHIVYMVNSGCSLFDVFVSGNTNC